MTNVENTPQGELAPGAARSLRPLLAHRKLLFVLALERQFRNEAD